MSQSNPFIAESREERERREEKFGRPRRRGAKIPMDHAVKLHTICLRAMRTAMKDLPRVK